MNKYRFCLSFKVFPYILKPSRTFNFTFISLQADSKQILGLAVNSVVLIITLVCFYKETKNLSWVNWINWNPPKKYFVAFLLFSLPHLCVDIIESIQCTETNCNGFPVSDEANYIIHTVMLILWMFSMCTEFYIFCMNLLFRAVRLLSILREQRLKRYIYYWRIALLSVLLAIFVAYAFVCFFYGPNFSTENAPIKTAPGMISLFAIILFVLSTMLGTLVLPFDFWANYSIIKLALKTSTMLARRNRKNASILPKLRRRLVIYLSSMAAVAVTAVIVVLYLGMYILAPLLCLYGFSVGYNYQESRQFPCLNF